MRIFTGLVPFLLWCIPAFADPAPPPRVTASQADVARADLPHYHASIRYQIHPRQGDYVLLKHVCDDRVLKERLWKVIRKLPVITAHQDGTLDLDLDVGTTYKPDKLFIHENTDKVVGWWLTSTPGVTIGVSLEERPKYPPLVQVVVKDVRPDASWCAAMWLGIGDKF